MPRRDGAERECRNVRDNIEAGGRKRAEREMGEGEGRSAEPEWGGGGIADGAAGNGGRVEGLEGEVMVMVGR